MVTLRPYQVRDITEIRSVFSRRLKRVVYVLATGGGKTIIVSFMVRSAVERGKRVLILAHRQEIIDQISSALSELDIPHGIIAPGHRPTEHAVQVASIASLQKRLQKVGTFHLIVIDEAHHAVSKMYLRIIEAFPGSYVLGVTATPERLDGRPLDIFQEMVVGSADVATLIREGYLSPYILFAPSTAPDLSGLSTRAGDYAIDELAHVMAQTVIVRSAVEAYDKHARGEPAVAFCVDRAHSEAVAAAFRKAGYRAAHVDGDSSVSERRRLIAALGTGGLDVLCNCGLISEGVDVPVVRSVILLRPTQSQTLHQQQIGRGLRAAPGKDKVTILDLAGNTFRHGLPDTPRSWSLTGRNRRDREPPPIVSRLRHCAACGILNPPGTARCCCGSRLKATPAERRDAALELIRVRQERLHRLSKMSYGDCLRWAGRSAERLQMVALARGYKPGFVHKRLGEMDDEERRTAP